MSIKIHERKYLHFDRPFFGDAALAAVSDPELVAEWSFMPFLHIDLKKVRVKRKEDGSLDSDIKTRPIFYAAHNGSGLDVEALIKEEIVKLALEIHPRKSTTHHFKRVDEALVCLEQKPVQYLGFLFDGKSIRLRTVALSRYYAKMRRGVRAVDRARKGSDLETGTQTPMKTRALHRRYTYLGRRNFVSYAHRAAAIMSSNAIRKQLKPHLARFASYVQMKDDRWLRRSESDFKGLRAWYRAKKGEE